MAGTGHDRARGVWRSVRSKSNFQDAFTQIEARLLAVETRSTSNEAMLADHEARIKTNEDELAQLNNTVAIPHVTSQYAFDSVSIWQT